MAQVRRFSLIEENLAKSLRRKVGWFRTLLKVDSLKVQYQVWLDEDSRFDDDALRHEYRVKLDQVRFRQLADEFYGLLDTNMTRREVHDIVLGRYISDVSVWLLRRQKIAA